MLLITGATGFLGQHIVQELLEAGYDLRVLVRSPQGRTFSWGSMVEIVEGDVLDVVSLDRAMEGVDQVIHAAALVSFWRRRHQEMRQVNVAGTANVVNLCLEKGISRLVHLSSIAAMGRNAPGEWIDEQSSWNPGQVSSVYGRSKHEQELEVFRGIAEGLEAVILNPGVVIGKTDNWEVNTGKIFSRVYKGLRFYQTGSTGWVAAEDVALAVKLAVAHALPAGERYILVGENLSQRELLTQVAYSVKKNPPQWQIPAWVVVGTGYMAQAFGRITGREPMLTPESMRGATKTYLYNGQKITKYGFRYTPLEQVIAQTGKAFLEVIG